MNKVKKVKKPVTPKRTKAKAVAKKVPIRVKGTAKVAKVTAIDQVFVDWQAGISIAELVVRHQITRSQCRRRLTDAAGGKAKFRELRGAGAGGHVASSGLRHTKEGGDGAAAAGPRIDDSKVKRLKVGATKGWPVENIYKPVMARVKTADGVRTIPWRERVLSIYTSLKSGKRYVTARPGESADILVNLGVGLGYARLKLYEHSRTASKAEASVKELAVMLERGKAQRRHLQVKKQTARKARKAVAKGGH